MCIMEKMENSNSNLLKVYEAAEVEIVMVDSSDIICTSGDKGAYFDGWD